MIVFRAATVAILRRRMDACEGREIKVMVQAVAEKHHISLYAQAYEMAWHFLAAFAMLACMKLSTDALATWRLIRTPSIGPVAYKQLIEKFGSAPEALHHLPDLCASKGRKCPPVPPVQEIETEYAALTAAGGQPLFLHDAAYPTLLRYIPDPPPMLHVLGDIRACQHNAIAVVGTRQASAAGQAFTRQLVTDLTAAGHAIISGLARGIDTIAHTTTLDQHGLTVAVVAGGIDHIYPPENKQLRQRIIDHGGCILTEQPCASVPTARHFPRRNRLIAGLARAVVVTEAARHSGTLITATYAGDYGREVFAVPGNPADAGATGCNHLLKQGAQMLETADDILKTVAQAPQFHPRPRMQYTAEPFTPSFLETDDAATIPDTATDAPAHDTPAGQIWGLLSRTPLAVDELIRSSQLPQDTVLMALTELELDGKLERTPGGEVKRA